MSATPRTDDAEAECATSGYVYADFARTLEAELARCRLALADEQEDRYFTPSRLARLRDLSQPTPAELL